MNSKLQYLSGRRNTTGEKYKLVFNMFTNLLSSHWPHKSKYVMLVAKLGICSSRGHYLISKLQCLSGGRYMTGEKYKLVLNMFTNLLSSHWPHKSKYVKLVAKLGICSSRGH